MPSIRTRQSQPSSVPARPDWYRVSLATLVVVQLGLVWALPVLPSQDLLQHWASARILVGYEDPALRFAELYLLPHRYQAYFAPYYFIRLIEPLVGFYAASRLLLSAYVLGVFAGIHAVARRLQEEAMSGPWSVLLSPVVIWGPVAMMGFLQFMLCIPVVLFGAAWVLDAQEDPKGARLLRVLLAGALVGSLHMIAAAAFALLAALLWAFARTRSSFHASGAAVAGSMLGVLLWSFVGETGAGSFQALTTRAVEEAFANALGLEFINALFSITWYDPPTTLSYVVWTVLGPYRWAGLLATAAALAFVALVFAYGPRPAVAFSQRTRIYAKAVASFALIACLLPWGIGIPSEATFINLRFIGLAGAAALPILPQAWFNTSGRRAAIVGLAFFVTGNFAVRSIAFNVHEVAPVRGLVASVPSSSVLMSLPMHNRSRYFAKLFRVTHFLPMLHTVEHGGVNTQYWAGYTHHLPIRYRPGRRLRQSPDWHPWEFEPEDLTDADYLLVQHPRGSASETRMREAWAAISPALHERCAEDSCSGDWCLCRSLQGNQPDRR